MRMFNRHALPDDQNLWVGLCFSDLRLALHRPQGHESRNDWLGNGALGGGSGGAALPLSGAGISPGNRVLGS